jgi:hypothetical protein
MERLRRGAFALLSAGVLLAGCGGDDDDNGGGGGTQLSAQERAALINAFATAGFDGGEYSSFILGGLQSYGTFTVPAAALRTDARLASLSSGDWSAAGVQYIVDVTVNGEAIQGAAASVVGWKGLDVSAQTIDEYVEFGGFIEGTDFPDQISGNAPDDVFGFYWDGESYIAQAGTASLASASFGGSTTDCSTDIPNFGRLTCSYRYGSMEGSFALDFQQLGGELTESFPSTAYDLPALRVQLSGNLTVPVVRAAEVKASLRALVAQP